MPTTLLAFAVVLGIIIFVHEFGHLLVAKAFGMRVFIFSLGFGKRLAGFKWGDTDCRISLVPLGGYVKLEGEPDDFVTPQASSAAPRPEDPATQVVALSDGEMVRVDAPDYFTNRPRWQRSLVYLAGPAMNALLTVVILSGFYMVGVGVDASRFDEPAIGVVDDGSPAARAGLMPGDLILAINGKPVPTWEDALYEIVLRPDRTLDLRVRRGGEDRAVSVRSEATEVERLGSIGVHPLVRVGEVSQGLPAEAAGVRPGDAILAIEGQPIRKFQDVRERIAKAGSRPLSFRLWREGRALELSITPRETANGLMIGVADKRILKKFGPVEAVREALRSTWEMTRQVVDIVGKLVTAQISPRTMMGPLGIAQASGDAARSGPDQLLWLVALISLQVGILNLFPLAPLDGGHLAILAVEGVARRDLSPTVKYWIMNAGAAAIFLLIGLVLYSDVSKLGFVRRMLE